MAPESEKEWLFAIDWNNPLYVAETKTSLFQPFGINVSWDDDTFVINVYLLLIVVRVGHVDGESV